MLFTVSVYGREDKGTGGEDTADARREGTEQVDVPLSSRVTGQSLVARTTYFTNYKMC